MSAPAVNRLRRVAARGGLRLTWEELFVTFLREKCHSTMQSKRTPGVLLRTCLSSSVPGVNRWLLLCTIGWLQQEAEAFRRLAAMSSFPTSLFGFFISQLCIGHLRAQLGTTPNIRPIVVGRCYSYIALVNPGLRIDCEEVWTRFEESVLLRSSLNATVDYRQMFDAIPQTWPCDRCLFWSKTRNLMHGYTAVERHFWTLEDTLVGFMFNDLAWCGQQKHSGFDFSSCPPWAASRRHPVYSLWRQASQNFAEMACGNVTVLLNGSISNAFNRKSMFGSVELDGLDPCRVDYVNIKVVTNLQGPFTESCTKGSIADLVQILRSRGFRWTCTHNDEALMILQCVQNPEQSSCLRCASGFPHGRTRPHAGPNHPPIHVAVETDGGEK